MKTHIINSPKYHVKIDAFSLLRFNHVLFSKYSQEFTAFAHCERDGDNFHIKEIFFPEQKNSGVKTEIDSEGMICMMADGADFTKLNGHLHSHVNMDVKPSGTDEDEILERAYMSDYNVALILNKSGDIFVHIADYTNNVYMTDIPFTVEYPFPVEEFEVNHLELIKESETLEEAKPIL